MNPTIIRTLALALALGLAGCLGPGTPEEQLESIEEMQAKNHPVTEEQKSVIEASIAEGREALAAGEKEKAGAAFTRALEVLQMAADAALYNKSD